MTLFTPADAEEAGAVVTWAMAEQEPLEVVGGGSKRPLGRPVQAAHTLDLRRLAGIVAYEPRELVLTARAATKLGEIETALAQDGQMLAFEPADWRGLFDTAEHEQTIGGVLACNLSGPRRITAGAARDHFLGFAAVNGRGERFKAGGKVVKNVTGYDLCKLLAGSHGTLAALTEMTLKVLPRPETRRTVLLLGLDDAAAIRALCMALGSPHEVSGAAHLPASVAARAGIGASGYSATLLRLEGPEPSVAYRCEALRRELCADGELAAPETERLWREIGNASLLADPRERAVWRISAPPASGAAIGEAIARALEAELYFDWGGGLIWCAVDARQADGGAVVLRGAIKDAGHAMLIRATESLRASVPVLAPEPPALAALSARVKDSFDPRRVLNPGRMYSGHLIMQTTFNSAQLADPDTRESEKILRACVHCGFCTATCPTYVLLGDELDGPRGRIYLIKDMLENDRPATEKVVRHVDRCLSCLSCMTTCPSGVNYMHLVDHARRHIEATYRRPWHDRAMRALLALVLPRPALFRMALLGSTGRAAAGTAAAGAAASAAGAGAALGAAGIATRPRAGFPRRR